MSNALTISQLVIGWALSVAYFVVYCFRPWRTTRAGRALWLKTLGNVIVLSVFCAGLLWPDYPFRPQVRFVGLLVFDAGLLYLLVAVVREPWLPRGPREAWHNPEHEEQRSAG